MSTVVFATNNRETALKYIRSSLPNKTVSEQDVDSTLSLVASGNIRVGDPAMYGGKAPIYPSQNYKPEDAKTIVDELSRLIS